MENITVKVNSPSGQIKINNTLPLVCICGPCVIEGEQFALDTAAKLKAVFSALDIPFIYKSSFDKANRSSINSYRGVGIDEGLKILQKVRNEIGIAVLTDVHLSEQVPLVAGVVDMMQTPAFLCRQTDFIKDVASAGIAVNIKKGQFLAPWEMENVVTKAKSTGNDQITLCERGTTFGYGNLVVDMKSLKIMAKTGHPVIFDATHSVQLPGAKGTSSGGEREYVASLARAATAIGIAGIFLEAHPDPDNAPCDGPNMISFSQLSHFLTLIKNIDSILK